METKKICIIIPYYNVELALFKKCIDSLKKQTFDSFEVIVIDDGSKQENRKAIQKLLQSEPFIRVIYTENKGVSAARNYGISLADAEIIGFVDADDYVSPFMLEKLYEVMKHTHSDIVTSYIKPVYDDEFKFSEIKKISLLPFHNTDPKKEMLSVILKGFSDRESEKGFISGGPCALLIKKNIVDKICFPEGIPYMEDVIWNYQVFSYANHFEIVDETLYAYRQNCGSATHAWKLSVISDRIKALQEIEKLVKDGEMRQWFAIRCLASYSIICKCIARTNELKGTLSRVKLARKCFKHSVWNILRESHIDVKWERKYKKKRKLAIYGILPWLYVLQAKMGK